MGKLWFVFGFLLLVFVFVFSNSSSSIVLEKVLLHPDKFDRLPDNLEPYCCGEIVGGRCDSKTDLETASDLIAKGMSPSVNFVPNKNSLRCD